MLVQLGIVAVTMVAGLAIAYYQGTSDTEIWNGQVTDKQSSQVSCNHSYQCNCVTIPSTDSRGHTTDTTICQTCYEHSYDVSWFVAASTKETITIDRVDRQGLNMPPRWGSVFVGEPFSSEHHFENYIKANPASVLLGQKGDLKKFGSLIPPYPKVFDYYRTNHVINMGVPNLDVNTWNWLISEANKTLGPTKQVNLILVFVKTDDPNYMYAFKDAWLGGKKNDAIILIGSQDGQKIDWADVVSWSTNKEYTIYVRDRIMEVGQLNLRDDIVKVIAEETQNRFQRMHMKDMKWLVYSFQPSSRAMLVLFILGVLTSIGTAVASIKIHKEEGYY